MIKNKLMVYTFLTTLTFLTLHAKEQIEEYIKNFKVVKKNKDSKGSIKLFKENSSEPVAYIKYDKKNCLIDDIKTNERNQGIGTWLLKQAMKEIENAPNECTQCNLCSLPEAVGFYEKNGFYSNKSLKKYCNRICGYVEFTDFGCIWIPVECEPMSKEFSEEKVKKVWKNKETIFRLSTGL